MTTTQDRSDLLNRLGLNGQNKAALGACWEPGKSGRPPSDADGTMEATIRINPDEIAWDPSILVMPHGGDIELELINDDLNTHCALLPSNGDRKFIWLVNHSQGTGDAQPRRPGLLLVQLTHRQRRGPRADRAPSSFWATSHRRPASTDPTQPRP